MKRLEFQVLLTFDGKTQVWAARGVNYDLVAQGKTIPEALSAFGCAVVARLVADLHDDVTPFANCPPAPEHVKQQFEDALQTKTERRFSIPEGLHIPPAYQIDAQLRDMRISA